MQAGEADGAERHRSEQSPRICFLFNHDQIHQIAHSLPIAQVMANDGTARITVAVTTDIIADAVRKIAGPDIARMDMVRLDLHSPVSRGLSQVLNGIVPARKILIYRDNLDFFRGFDALVVSEKTSLQLNTRYGLDDLAIIHTRHGAGDRAIGFGRESAQFDLVLVSGAKIARRLQNEAGVSADRIRITGYSKFDLYAGNRRHIEFPDPNLPVVLYSPHPSPQLSSWFAMGTRVLDELTASGRYNVIFAPHMMLFRRKYTVTIAPPAIRRVVRPDAELSNRTNLHIDLGSSASADMTYINAADIFIGDVSSQTYEFLLTPRPCLHLDAHGAAWRSNPDYRHWLAGPVVPRDGDIVSAVDNAIATHGAYLPAQRDLLEDTFSVEENITASRRAADAILEFLNG